MKVEEIITENDFKSLSNLTYPKFCELLNKITSYCIEESLKNLPHVITSLTNQAAYLKSLSEEFYDRNKDLVEHKDVVRKTIENIEANNPGMDYKQILSIAAPRARQTLSLMNGVKP